MYRYRTGLSPELLDIDVLKDILPPGCFSPRRHNVAQTRSCFPGHAYFGRGNGSKDHRYGAWRRADNGGSRWASSANALEGWRASSANALESWRASSANALEVSAR